MTLLQALELVASLIPGFGPAVRALRLLRIAVRIAELVRSRSFASFGVSAAEDQAELDQALAELEAEERAS